MEDRLGSKSKEPENAWSATSWLASKSSVPDVAVPPLLLNSRPASLSDSPAHASSSSARFVLPATCLKPNPWSALEASFGKPVIATATRSPALPPCHESPELASSYSRHFSSTTRLNTKPLAAAEAPSSGRFFMAARAGPLVTPRQFGFASPLCSLEPDSMHSACSAYSNSSVCEEEVLAAEPHLRKFPDLEALFSRDGAGAASSPLESSFEERVLSLQLKVREQERQLQEHEQRLNFIIDEVLQATLNRGFKAEGLDGELKTVPEASGNVPPSSASEGVYGHLFFDCVDSLAMLDARMENVERLTREFEPCQLECKEAITILTRCVDILVNANVVERVHDIEMIFEAVRRESEASDMMQSGSSTADADFFERLTKVDRSLADFCRSYLPPSAACAVDGDAARQRRRYAPRFAELLELVPGFRERLNAALQTRHQWPLLHLPADAANRDKTSFAREGFGRVP